MGNVFRILARDFGRLCKAPAAMIVVVALLVLPSLYTWYNVVAFWNPYEATGNLHVCVVNEDAGAETTATGALNVGDSIVEALQSNDKLGWVIEGYDDAMNDLMNGDVYAVYVIPEDFSACLVSPLTGEVKSPTLKYYANEKLGPVSPKITDAGASALDETINSMFVATVSETAVNAVDKAIREVEADIAETDSQASARADSVRSAIADVRSALAGIQAAASEAQAKVSETSASIGDASLLANDAQIVLRDVSNEADEIQRSLSNLTSSIVPALSDVMAQLTKVTAKGSEAADKLVSFAGAAEADVELATARIEPVVTVLRDTASDLEKVARYITIDEKLKEEVLKAAADVNDRATRLQAALDDAVAASKRVEEVSQTVSNDAASLNDAAQRASLRLQDYSDKLFKNVMPTVNSSLAEVSSVSGRLSAAISNLNTAIEEARPALRQLGDILGNCVDAIMQTDRLVGGVQDDLDSVLADAHMLVQSGKIADLIKSGTLNSKNISEFMGSPTKLNTVQFYHPNAYGSAMAPLFMNLTFWIGAFMLVILFRLEVDSEGIKNPAPWQRYLSRFILFAIIVVLQALICCAGTMMLGVQVANVPALLVASALAALAYLSIIYALSATFKHMGKGLCIVLVFAQIPGGSGLYPVEMTSSFFKAIYPFLPFSYGIDAMRESIGGLYGNFYTHDLLVLGVFFFGSLALGLFLGPLMSNVVRMTSKQIREGDLYSGENVVTPARPYRLAQVLRALTERESYRQEIEERYERFTRHYPVFIRVSIVLGVGVPVVLAFLLALDAAEKVTLLTITLIWLLALMGFLVVVESMRYSFERQLGLESMSNSSLLDVFARRNHMASISEEISGHRLRRRKHGESTATDEETDGRGEVYDVKVADDANSKVGLGVEAGADSIADAGSAADAEGAVDANAVGIADDSPAPEAFEDSGYDESHAEPEGEGAVEGKGAHDA